MDKLILEYIMCRLNEENIKNEEKTKLLYVANMILDMYIIENK